MVDSEGRSLVSRVCAEDPTLSVARHEMDILASARTYHEQLLPSTNVGTTMVLLTLTIWFMQYARDLFRNVQFQLAWLELPRSRHTVIQKQADDLTLRFESIAWTRLAWVSTINLIRFSVATGLLLQGSLWLIYETDLTDVVINGIALSFVLDVDELLYEAFTPLPFERLRSSVQPLDVPFLPKRPLFTILLFACYLAYVSTEIVPNNIKLDGYLDDMCGGNKDFAIAYHPSLHMYFSTSTTPSAGEGGPVISDKKISAVSEMISFSQSSSYSPATPAKSQMVLAGVSRLKKIGKCICKRSCRHGDDTRMSR